MEAQPKSKHTSILKRHEVFGYGMGNFAGAVAGGVMGFMQIYLTDNVGISIVVIGSIVAWLGVGSLSATALFLRACAV